MRVAGRLSPPPLGSYNSMPALPTPTPTCYTQLRLEGLVALGLGLLLRRLLLEVLDREHLVGVEGEVEAGAEEDHDKEPPCARDECECVHAERDVRGVGRGHPHPERAGLAVDLVPAHDEEHGGHEEEEAAGEAEREEELGCGGGVEEGLDGAEGGEPDGGVEDGEASCREGGPEQSVC